MSASNHPWSFRPKLAVLIACFAAAGCDPEDDAPQLTALTVDPASAQVEVGATRAFRARAQYSDGRSIDLTTTAQWTTSDPAIATVGAMDGNARGVGPGAATLTATVGQRSARATLTVAPARVLTITITPAMPADLPVGMTRAFRVTGTHLDGTTVDLTEDPHLFWSSSNAAVASISVAAGMRGVATGVGEGATDIGALYDDRSNPVVNAVPVSLHVTRSPLTSLALEPVGSTVPRGYTVQFRLVGTYADAHVEDLTGDARTVWSSAMPALATISNETGLRGLATGVAAGEAEIRAEFGGQSAATALRITDATLSAIAVTPAAVTVTRGGSVRLRATGVFSDMTTMDLSDVAAWESADAARAAVSSARGTAGVVTVAAAAAPGPVLITARRGTISSSATITVNMAVTLQRLDLAVDQTLVPLGLTARARAFGTYGDGVTTFSRDVTEQVTWSATGAAMISNAAGEHGLITGNMAGAASVGATLDGVTGATVPITVTACPLNALQIADGAALTLARGTSRQLTARALYDTAMAGCESLGSAWYDVTAQPRAVWTSSNTAVLTVGNAQGSRGLVRAAAAPVAPASADVQARFGTLMASTRITVLDACARAITVSAVSDSLPAGIEVPFRAIAAMSDGTSRDVTAGSAWVSANNAVASVDPRTGVVRTNGPGASAITAQVVVAARCADATGGSFALTVNDATIAGVAVDPPVRVLARGERAQLRAIGTFSDMRQFDLTPVAAWSSSNAAVAAVSAGLVQASPGTDGNAIVTAAFGARDGFANITVSGARLQRIAVGLAPSYACGTNPAGAYPAGARVPLVATGFFSDMTSRPLSGAAWVGDNASLPVADNGVVSVLGAGAGRFRAVVGSVQSEPFSLSGAAATLTALQVSPPSGWEMPLGSDLRFSAAGVFTGFAGSCPLSESVTWTATATAPASLSITRDGYARAGAGGAGAASVRAAMGTVTAVSAGAIRGACANGLMVEPAAASTPVGVRVDVTAFLTYSDGSRARVWADWSTGAAAVARAFNAIDPLGRAVGSVAPLSVGRTTINARVTTGPGAACAGRDPVFTASAALEVTDERLASISVDCTTDPGVSRCNFGDAARPAYPAGLVIPCRAYGQGTAGARWDFTDSVDWSSNNPEVMQVSDTSGSRGLARSVSAGSAVIVARYGAVSGARTVDVNAAALQAVTVTPGAVNLPAGFTQRFSAEGTFALPGASRQCAVTRWADWTSSNPQVVAVGTTGDYRAMAWMLSPSATPVTVGASFLGQTGAATVTVNSATLAALTVVPTTAQIGVGQTANFAAAGRYSDGSARDVTGAARWSTGDSRVAVVANTFGQYGIARGVSQGATVVRAEIGGIVSEAQLGVTGACVRSLTVTTFDGVLYRPARVPVTFLARATYSDGAIVDVSDTVQWTTSDEAICPAPHAVDGYQVSTTRAVGGATIAASIPGCAGLVTTRIPLTVNAAVLRSIDLRGASGGSATPVNVAMQFRAFGTYSDSTLFDVTPAIESWSLGNPSVATLGGGGVVIGRAAGTSTLTATQGTVSGATTLTVTAATLTSIRVAALDLTGSCRDATDPGAYVGTGYQAPVSSVGRLRAYGTYSDQSVRDLTDEVLWTANDPTIAVALNVPTVRGTVFHRAAGSTLLRASMIQGATSISDSVVVEVRAGALASLAINPGGARPLAVARGNRPQLALVGDYGAAGRYCVAANAAWSSADPAVATVHQGLVTTLATGGTAITAAIGSVSDSMNILVGSPTLSYVEVTPRTLTVARWSTSRFRALAHYSDGTVDDVSANPTTLWSSTNLNGTNVLWVDPGTLERGLIWALAPGQARVDACIGTLCASAAPDRSAVATVTP
jgi:uncharacterized protein YjdB